MRRNTQKYAPSLRISRLGRTQGRIDKEDSIDEYDTIVLGYPNYWGTFPMAVATFLERYDFAGKTMLPLCTNEGSGMGSSESVM